MGNGWCLPECHVLRDVRQSTCLLNARRKDFSNLDECRAACDNEEGCTGFAVSNWNGYCYIYGNFSSTNQGVTSSWEAMPGSYVEINSASGAIGMKCWKRAKEIANVECNYLFSFFSQN